MVIGVEMTDLFIFALIVITILGFSEIAHLLRIIIDLLKQLEEK